MARWAVFDVDGTLLPGTSMERMLIFHMLRQGNLPVRNVIHYLLTGLSKWVRGDGADAFRNNKVYLKEIPHTLIRDTARSLLFHSVIPRLSEQGLLNLALCRREGFRILVLSGSPDFLTIPLGEYLAADHSISAVLEKHDGYYTGRIVGLHPYGERKTEILERVQSCLELDFDNSIVFANHHSDADHLSRFARAVAVNPTPRLKDIAHQRGWSVESWD